MQKLLIEICNPKQWKTIATSEFKDSGYPVYGANGKIGFYDKYTHKEPTLMITCRGATCGTLNISESYSYINGNAMALDNLDNKNVDLKYLYYYLSYRGLKDTISGSAQPQITRTNLSMVKIYCPNIKTQQKISSTLDQAQFLIDKRKAQIEALDELVKSRFIEMFGNPVTNPKRWDIATLDEVCTFIKDGPHASPKYVGSGIPFVSVNNIINDFWDFSNVKYISREDYEVFSKRCKPEKGDVLYTKGGTTGFAKYVDIDIEFCNWVHIAVLKYKKDIMNGIFLTKMLNTNYCYAQSQRYTRGIANRDLVLSQMKLIKFFVPPIKLQNQFATFANQVDKLKFEMEKSLKELEDNFNSLMQKAFKGELFN